MRNFFLLGGLLAGAVLVFGQQDRLLVPIDTRSTVVLKGNMNPRAQTRYDQGAEASSKKISEIRLTAKLSPSQQTSLDQLLAAQQDPASSDYHRWLTPEQYADRFGLSANDLARITTWLRTQGFTVDYAARARNYVMFSGTVGQVQIAFHTEIHRYQIGAETHFANATDPSIPAALEPLVQAILGLDDFRPRPRLVQKAPSPDVTQAGVHYLSPGDIATIYNINPLYQQNFNGSGQNLVVVGQTQINVSDIQAFRAEFGLPSNTPTLTPVPGSTNPGIVKSDLDEATLDLEYSGGSAPGANVIFVYSSDVSTSEQYAIDQNIAPVISSSYGECELSVSSQGSYAASIRQSAQQANAQGITWVSASGDDGAADCDYGSNVTVAKDGLSVNWPASIPEITAVGGTEFNEGSGNYWSSTNLANGSSALSYIPEMAWNDTTQSLADRNGLSSTGGGASILYTKPAWQTGTGVPNDGARDLPDISFAASDYHDGYVVYVSGKNVYGIGGTSVSTPIFAGVLAVMNQYLVAKKTESTPGLGNINPKLYSLAQSPGNNIFNDVTVGNNVIPCKVGTPTCTTGNIGYNTGTGYDQATGLGSANITNLVTGWNGSGQTSTATTTTISANPSSISVSGTTVLTATVKAASGSTSPTGSVSFVWGLVSLGTATLSGSGGSASASITVYGSVFSGALGNESINAYYGGNISFAPSSGSAFLIVTGSTTGSAVIPSVTPDPVYQQTTDAQGYSWFFTVRLSEIAGVATTLTGFSFLGHDYSSDITQWFGNANLPANGTLSANLRVMLNSSPQNVVFSFSGVDGSGKTWTQQITVPFLPAQVSGALSLTSAPTTVAETPKGVAGCPIGFRLYYQQLNLQELNGVEVELTRFQAGGNDYTANIPDWFGSWRLAPYGSLLADICWSPNTVPSTFDYEIDGVDTSGNDVVVTATAPFEGAVTNAGTLSSEPKSVSFAPGDSGTAQVALTINVPGGQAWNATVFPANPRTSWLVIYPLSGAGTAQMNVTASSANLAPGVYQATVVIQSINTIPQFVTVPVTFTVGESSTMSIFGIRNNFSGALTAAPGMLAAVYGANLASGAPITASLPLLYSMGGVSATVNGIPAPLYYVSPNQLDIQIPYETPSGSAILAVNNNGSIAAYTFQVDETLPGVAMDTNQFAVPLSNGLRGGTTTLFMTGDGDVTQFWPTGASPPITLPLAQLPAPRLPVTVTIGSVPATVQFVGIPYYLVGVTQINVQIPLNAPKGLQPLIVTVGSVPANTVYFTVN